jgi:sulfate transport system ATP-binding protein
MSVVLQQLTKRYDGHPVVNNVSLEVADGEFFVLLGSSGSGKTTVLNMIAGLTDADEGRVLLHGRDVTYISPQRRRVGLVFQHYALFKYMSVADNIQFGLRIRKVASEERRQRCEELLDMVGMAGLGDRMPHHLSGGQQQRVALARALAYRPDVLLLDEPLGALDAKIRRELRRTLRAIQRDFGVTAILVTHDQSEAFELADRLGVMHAGRLLEIGTPTELYEHPQTEFVATFLGSANLLLGQGSPEGAHIGPIRLPWSGVGEQWVREGRVQVLFRPEDVSLAPDVETLAGDLLARCEIEECTFAGSFEQLRLRMPAVLGSRPLAPRVPFGDSSVVVEAVRSPDEASRYPLEAGDSVWVGVRRVHALSHPGMSFLVATDGSPHAQSALDLGGQIARQAHGRVTLLSCTQWPDTDQQQLRKAKEQLGGGLAGIETQTSTLSPVEALLRATEHHSYDLVVIGFGPPGRRCPAARTRRTAGLSHRIGGQCGWSRSACARRAVGGPRRQGIARRGDRFASRHRSVSGADCSIWIVGQGSRQDGPGGMDQA